MIKRIIAWIRERWWSLIGRSSIKEKLDIELSLSEAMITALQKWTLMYENDAPWLDDYTKSMNLPAAISAEVARVATIEMEVVIEGSARADFLSEQFEKVMDKIRDVIEFGSAKGGIVIKPYVIKDELFFDFVQADQFFPVDYDGDGRIKAAVFVDQRTKGDKNYTRLEYHSMEEGGCRIRNKAFVSDARDMLGKEINLDVIEDWVDLEEEAFIENIDKPLYVYYRVPGANNIDTASPLGVSCFARAVDLIEQADVQWSDLLWEFESGKRALYIDTLAFGKDDQGRAILPNKRLYRAIETGTAEGDLFEEWSPTLREVNILNGLDAILKKIEFVCGLAYGTISDPATVDKTATEIKISKQRTFAMVVDTQKAVERVLTDLLEVMDVWVSLSGLAPKGKHDATFTFDDSVIVDKDTQFQQDLRLVGGRIMSKIEFRMRNFGEDEETAKKRLEEVEAEQPEEQYEKQKAGEW